VRRHEAWPQHSTNLGDVGAPLHQRLVVPFTADAHQDGRRRNHQANNAETPQRAPPLAIGVPAVQQYLFLRASRPQLAHRHAPNRRRVFVF